MHCPPFLDLMDASNGSHGEFIRQTPEKVEMKSFDSPIAKMHQSLSSLKEQRQSNLDITYLITDVNSSGSKGMNIDLVAEDDNNLDVVAAEEDWTQSDSEHTCMERYVTENQNLGYLRKMREELCENVEEYPRYLHS